MGKGSSSNKDLRELEDEGCTCKQSKADIQNQTYVQLVMKLNNRMSHESNGNQCKSSIERNIKKNVNDL